MSDLFIFLLTLRTYVQGTVLRTLYVLTYLILRIILWSRISPPSFFSHGNWGPENLSNLCWVTKLVGDNVGRESCLAPESAHLTTTLKCPIAANPIWTENPTLTPDKTILAWTGPRELLFVPPVLNFTLCKMRIIVVYLPHRVPVSDMRQYMWST